MTATPNCTFNIQGDAHIYPTAATVNNFFGDSVSATAMKMNLSQGSGEEENTQDELLVILKDKELYDETVKWAKTCKKPKDIRDRIFVPLRRKGMNDTGIDFIKALIPHLTNYASSKNPSTIQKQLY